MNDDKIKARYNRIAPIYDKLELFMEKAKVGTWREEFWTEVKEEIAGRKIKLLEAGVGTGKNFFYYPENIESYAVDFSKKMLAQAEERKNELEVQVDLLEMDIQNLDFADNSFDVIVASCVFCSVPNPVQGFKELKRVCKPDGKIFLLEHMRTEFEAVGKLMDLFNFFSLFLWGANINRHTMKNIKQAGLKIVKEEKLCFDVVKKLVLSPYS